MRPSALFLAKLAADEAEILTLGVRAGRQRHGIASRLIEALIGAARAAGARALFLDVGRRQYGCPCALSRLRFEERGRRRAYYVKANAAPGDAVTFALAL